MNLSNRILFIEDDVVDQMAIKRMAKENMHDLKYDICNSIGDAFQQLANNNYDVIVTDYQLGDGNAMDVVEHVVDSPVIFVTGMGNEELAVTAMKSGAYDYLIKDPDYQYLKVLPLTLTRAISHKRNQQKATRIRKTI